MADDLAMVERIYDLAGQPFTDDARRAITAFMDSPSTGPSRHRRLPTGGPRHRPGRAPPGPGLLLRPLRGRARGRQLNHPWKEPGRAHHPRVPPRPAGRRLRHPGHHRRRRPAPALRGLVPGRGRHAPPLAQHGPPESEEPVGEFGLLPVPPRPGQPLPLPRDPGRRRGRARTTTTPSPTGWGPSTTPISGTTTAPGTAG